MPTNILSVGTINDSSADVVVTAADLPYTVALKDAAGPDVEMTAQVLILLKDDTGQYFRTNLELNGMAPVLALQAPGTYRFDRIGGKTCGVFHA